MRRETRTFAASCSPHSVSPKGAGVSGGSRPMRVLCAANIQCP